MRHLCFWPVKRPISSLVLSLLDTPLQQQSADMCGSQYLCLDAELCEVTLKLALTLYCIQILAFLPHFHNNGSTFPPPDCHITPLMMAASLLSDFSRQWL